MNRIEFDRLHKACPKCGNVELCETYVAFVEFEGEYFDSNKASCSCGWSGKVCDLVEEKKK